MKPRRLQILCFPGLSMPSWNYVKKRPLVGGLITNGSLEGQLMMYYGSLLAERDLVPIEKTERKQDGKNV